MSNERLGSLAELARVDYELAMETWILTLFPYVPDQLRRDLAGLMRAGIDETGFRRLVAAAQLWDADSDAASI